MREAAYDSEESAGSFIAESEEEGSGAATGSGEQQTPNEGLGFRV